MYSVTILKWAVLTFFPLVTTVPIPPFAPRPLCNFQLALANQACAYLPSSQVPPPPSSPFNTVRPSPPPPPERHLHIHSHGHSHSHSHSHSPKHGDEQGHDDHGNNETHVPEQGHDHDHGHDHGHNRHEQHKHDHIHGHHKHHRLSPVEQQCCKWLAQVDDECVCELLGRLPPFLARPIHEYTLRVAGSCNVTYSCGELSRI